MYMLKVSDLKRYLSNALETLEDFDDDILVEPRSNTYKLSMPYLATNNGYIPLNEIEQCLDDDTYEDYRVMDSKKSVTFKQIKKLVSESKSVYRELVEYAEDWIDRANKNYKPGFEDEHIVAAAKYEEELNFQEIIDGILKVYSDIISPKAREVLENSKEYGSIDITLSSAFHRAIENIATTLKFQGY